MSNANPALIVRGEPLPILDLPIHEHWTEAATAKGFDLVARVRDRYHLALACRTCGELSSTKLFVLTRNKPICRTCLEAAWRREAEAAGVTFLRRDPNSTAYAWYRLRCGHEARRQIGLITRAAAGGTGLRCGTCQDHVEIAEAEAAGWELRGPDPKGDTNYRLYRHCSCGHEQRIARGNLKTHRFDCAGCGVTWTAAPSHLYLIRVLLPTGARLLKLGYARKPLARITGQLPRRSDVVCQVLRLVPIPTGHEAVCTETNLHATLRREFPEAVIPAHEFADYLRVTTEVYAGWLEVEIQSRLDRIEDQIGPRVGVS